jgi:hypothetical protein
MGKLSGLHHGESHGICPSAFFVGEASGSVVGWGTMALGSAQPLTEMNNRNLPAGKWRPACKADNLTSTCEPIVSKMWKP